METRSSPCMTELRAIAAQKGLKFYLHLSKPELFLLLQRQDQLPHTTASVQTKANVKRRRMMVTQKLCCNTNGKNDNSITSEELCKKIRMRAINQVDPIMLTELGPHTFEFVRSNGSVVSYNVDSLIGYMLSTGDFSEPETRIAFSDEDLRRIDSVAEEAKLDRKSVLKAKYNKHEFEKKKVERDGLLGLERCAGECITSMLKIVEDDDEEMGQIILLTDLFPSFSSLFEQIRNRDKEYAKYCMDHYLEYLQGPPNRPTVDVSGLLSIIVDFLKQVRSGLQDASAFGF